jgi:ankyrin repeat protein
MASGTTRKRKWELGSTVVLLLFVLGSAYAGGRLAYYRYVVAPRLVQPLFDAILTGDERAVEELLKQGADPNTMFTYGQLPNTDQPAEKAMGTPLMFASYKNESLVRLLLARGANPDLKNADGVSAVSFARERNLTKAVALMEAAKATRR